MTDPICEISLKLSAILDHTPVDWDKFDTVLRQLEDINCMDKDLEESLLSDLVQDIEDSSLMPKVIRHFLACGYDVKAHGGKNGTSVLHALCWSTRSRYVLDAAKILLDAGTPTMYHADEDMPPDEEEDVLKTIGWKLSGTWNIDEDYKFANILEAYYQMMKAVRQGKAYASIDCYLPCLKQTLTAVSVDTRGTAAFKPDGVVTEFSQPLIFWFEDTPLLISPYRDFVINPVYAEENRPYLREAGSVFSALIGARLESIEYAEPGICYMDFDNGMRILFAPGNAPTDSMTTVFEIRRREEGRMDIESLVSDQIYGHEGTTFPGSVAVYSETALAFFRGEEACLLYSASMSVSEEEDVEYLRALPCSRELLKKYTRRYSVDALKSPVCFYKYDKPAALRFACGNSYLYIKADCGIETALTDALFDPIEYDLEYAHPRPLHFASVKGE